MSDGHYSTVVLGWSDIHMLLNEVERLREVERLADKFGRRSEMASLPDEAFALRNRLLAKIKRPA